MDKRSNTSSENGKKGGRPKGSYTRPVIRDYFTKEEIKELVDNAKLKAKEDPAMLRFLIEHVFGKATQPIDGGSDDKGNVIPLLNVLRNNRDRENIKPKKED
jgi:hypothetical protein